MEHNGYRTLATAILVRAHEDIREANETIEKLRDKENTISNTRKRYNAERLKADAESFLKSDWADELREIAQPAKRI